MDKAKYEEIESAYYSIKWNGLESEVKQGLQAVARQIRKVDHQFNKTSRNTVKELKNAVWSWMVANEPEEE